MPDFTADDVICIVVIVCGAAVLIVGILKGLNPFD